MNAANNAGVEVYLRELDDIQYVINLNASSLDEYRLGGATHSAEVQSVVKDTEAKLLKYFSRALFHKSRQNSLPLSQEEKVHSDCIASLETWLRVVNIDPNIAQLLIKHLNGQSLEQVISMPDTELESVCNRSHLYGEERRRFLKATRNLSYFATKWIQTGKQPILTEDFELSWSSYDRFSTSRSNNNGGNSLTPSGAPGMSSSGSGGLRSPSATGLHLGSESGSGVESDSGLGSNMSQTSLPTTTPPASPGFATVSSTTSSQHFATVRSSKAGSPAPGGPRSATGIGQEGPAFTFPHPYTTSRSGNLPLTPTGFIYKPGTGGAHGHKSSLPTVPRPALFLHSSSGGRTKAADSVHRPRTPPPVLKFGTMEHPVPPARGSSVSSNDEYGSTKVAGSPFAIQRSRSHESQLAHRITPCTSQQPSRRQSSTAGSPALPRSSLSHRVRRVASTVGYEGGASGSACLSPAVDAVFVDPGASTSLSPPATDAFRHKDRAGSSSKGPSSPITGTMRIDIPHRWEHRRMNLNKLFKECQNCLNTFSWRYYYKCTSCKMHVCRDCKDKMYNNCGVGVEFLQQVKNLMLDLPKNDGQARERSGSEVSGLLDSRVWGQPRRDFRDQRKPSDPTSMQQTSALDLSPSVKESRSCQHITSTTAHWGEMSSGSSCTSSAPSTPAPHLDVVVVTGTAPDVPDINIVNSEAALTDTVTSNDSDTTLVHSGGSGRHPGTDSETTTASWESSDECPRIRRDQWATLREKTSSWSEWKIDLTEIHGLTLVGRGQFGIVKKGYWYQPVAVKFLSMDHVASDQQLDVFKREVFSFRNTRHENVILFLGYCVGPSCLGIVMNFCEGSTLFTLLHLSRELPMEMDRAIHIASQISVGMSYLHGKKIIHKDLRSKNVFIEKNDKVVITDFGLFSIQRLCKTSTSTGRGSSRFLVPTNWLCYLAPELIRHLGRLSPVSGDFEDLPFSFASDVYAFGTVWYELLMRDMPFKHEDSETVIWKVGHGLKPPCNFREPKELKEVMMSCWNSRPPDRPQFHVLHRTLDRLPKRRLSRSPSQPVHLSRSAESVF